MPSLSRYRGLANVTDDSRRGGRAHISAKTTDVHGRQGELNWGRNSNKLWGLGEHGV